MALTTELIIWPDSEHRQLNSTLSPMGDTAAKERWRACLKRCPMRSVCYWEHAGKIHLRMSFPYGLVALKDMKNSIYSALLKT